MAEQSSTTVADLLPAGIAQSPAMEEALGEDPALHNIRLAWEYVRGPLEEALRGLLDCRVIDLLAEVWLKARSLQDYAHPPRHPPDETWTVHLAEHRFEHQIHPVLKVSVAAFPPVELRFTLVLSAQVRGLALRIRGGHVLGGSAGDVTVSAQLKYRAINLTEKQESEKMKLPGTFEFAEPGLEIPPPRDGSAAEA